LSPVNPAAQVAAKLDDFGGLQVRAVMHGRQGGAMSRMRKSGHRQNKTVRAVLPALAVAVVQPAGGPPDEPDRSEYGSPGQGVAPAAGTAARSDIERASERGSRSIESVPQPAPTAGLASFEEPSGRGPAVP
jgi:hypothetical protein